MYSFGANANTKLPMTLLKHAIAAIKASSICNLWLKIHRDIDVPIKILMLYLYVFNRAFYMQFVLSC